MYSLQDKQIGKCVTNINIRGKPITHFLHMAFQSSSDHNLLRFLTAQESTYDTALSEIKRGKKMRERCALSMPQVSVIFIKKPLLSQGLKPNLKTTPKLS